MGETEDPGISVDDIAHDSAKLEEKARHETKENVTLDSDWVSVAKFESSSDVRAVLLRPQSPPGGVARVEGPNPRYTYTDKVTEIVLVAAKPNETLILLGYPTVRRFRRR